MTTLDLLGTGSSWLLTYALHSTLLIGGAWLVTRRVRATVVRDTLWKAAMFGSVLTATVQVATGYKPFAGRLQVSLDEAVSVATIATTPTPRPVMQDPFPVASAPAISPVTPAPGMQMADAVAPVAHEPIEVAPVAAPTPLASRVVATVKDTLARLHWSFALMGVWIIGAGIGVTRLLWARFNLFRCLRSRRPVRDPSLRRYVTNFSAMAGIRRPIELTWSSVLAVPAALRSEVCLPKRALFEMNIEKHRSVIAHEVAHIARQDPVWFFTSLLVERVFFFQPLNRLARRRMQELAEYICDDWAMYRAGSKRSLAESLADVAGWIKHAQPVTMLPSAGQDASQLVRRVERILETTSTPEAWMPKRSRVAAVFVGLFFVALLLPGISCAKAASPTPLTPLNDSPAAQTVTPSAVIETPIAAAEPAYEQPDAWQEPIVFDHVFDWVDVPSVDVMEFDAIASLVGDLEFDATASLVADLEFVDAPVVDFVSGAVELEDLPPIVTADMTWSSDVVSVAAPVLSADAVVAITNTKDHSQQDTPDPRVIRGLIEALQDQSAEVRKEAASALGRIGDSTAVMPLARALSDANPEVRATAAGALARYRDARAVPALAAALGDSESGVRRYALRALVRTRHESVVPALIGALNDESHEVREMAADVLGDMKDARAVPGLNDATRDAHPDVREEAIQSLYEIRDARAVPALIAATRDSVAKVRRIAASALGHFGDVNAVPALIDRLSDSEAIVRRYAVSSLGRLKDARAVDPLVTALKDSDAEVRTAVVRALAQLRDSGTW